MDNDKSIFEKITDKVKDIANIAADAAHEALKPEEPPKAAEPSVSYIPLAADGLVSDPMLVPPIAVVPIRKRKRAAPKRVAKAGKTARVKTSAKKAVKKSARKAAKTPSKKSRKAAKNRQSKANKKTANKAGKKARKIRRRS
jgi:hypothetical protein